MEHNTYQGLPHRRLNRIFELAKILCQPCPEPIVRKRKSATTVMALVPRKTSGRHDQVRRSSHSRSQTSAQELALAKALKPSKKSTTKAFAASVKAAGKKTLCTSTGRGSVTRALKHVLNLFDSDLSASDSKTAPLERPLKHSKESPLDKDIPKFSALKGFFE
jgi:hypothetical protein